MELFSNLGDWPLEHRAKHEHPIPIFSWCGSDDTHDIIMPTYDITESTLETLGRYRLILFVMIWSLIKHLCVCVCVCVCVCLVCVVCVDILYYVNTFF